VCLVGVGVVQVLGLRGAAGGVRLELSSGELSAGAGEGAARRGSISAGRQGLGASGAAESTVDTVQWRRRARHDVDGVRTGKAGSGRFYSEATLLPSRRSKG
jgi:hypothetical protein